MRSSILPWLLFYTKAHGIPYHRQAYICIRCNSHLRMTELPQLQNANRIRVRLCYSAQKFELDFRDCGDIDTDVGARNSSSTVPGITASEAVKC